MTPVPVQLDGKKVFIPQKKAKAMAREHSQLIVMLATVKKNEETLKVAVTQLQQEKAAVEAEKAAALEACSRLREEKAAGEAEQIAAIKAKEAAEEKSTAAVQSTAQALQDMAAAKAEASLALKWKDSAEQRAEMLLHVVLHEKAATQASLPCFCLKRKRSSVDDVADGERQGAGSTAPSFH